ncbi:poly(beta-D-mannuronate) lyase [Arcticibacter svalbardensis MN12-7]|uniref:Poly(Beta-D-mannuronate) lyase n=1 Tax=Arcticibacter svalbardensis MN12-7 TaxID=1150600 RepID=R9GT59_9SPHI|nr:heparinase II/III family protein [Arcticibacter svalbardensis]EOR94901.1 poly(beta-D-mannuronate) lyase [Arcticibacter svalbardensis MN12-7]
MNYLKKVVVVVFCIYFPALAAAQTHPNIMLTKQNIDAVRAGLEKYPLLQDSYKDVLKVADQALASPIQVPVPKDGGGGLTHEQHKVNYQNILACGIAFQLSKEKKYANYVRDILLNYAGQYEKWPYHPKSNPSNPPGKIFWQNLNDCVWQVHVIQGYDLVYDALSSKDKQTIEKHLFLPILKFITVDSYKTFNRIHNHGTWAVAAVGLTGYVLNKPEYVEMALNGSDKKGKSGFLAQINELFSPDGYYTEGFYYQRYAILPFILFAKAIQQYQPQLKIYQYRNGLLQKAVNTALQGTYSNGAFFPINDALKDKTFESEELVYGVDIAYADMGEDKGLLSIAQKQKKVIVSDAGLKVAMDIEAHKATAFTYIPQWIGDGKTGTDGGIGILRNGQDQNQQCLVLKATSQGLGHGHFDRLNILYYDNGAEVFSDYGAARFINIETKGGGGYLPENTTWAKQTIAHNTLVVDQTSAFKANLEEAETHHPDLVTFKNSGAIQVVSAKENNAYPGVQMTRSTALIQVPELKKSLLLDVYKAESVALHQYDLPFWYNGHIVDASFKIQGVTDHLTTLGTKYGYEHLWLNSENDLKTGQGYITILEAHNFYTTTFASTTDLQVKLVSLGANDPEMNLKESKAFILSQPKAANQTFVSITENHGSTDPIAEVISGANSSISAITIIHSDAKQTTITFKIKSKSYTVKINYLDKDNFISIQ